ncbi:MAG: 50S ribosomal protein L29 [Pseudobdellovibrionaceae bacterium]|jgi:large subunit ribosomal protein L29|nr:50S ribosomal protein L29 [Pseudobdellovibrionaceae bacterium]
MAKAKATNKAEDLKGKSADELNAMLLDLRKQQMDMRFQVAGGQMQNTAEIRKVRRTIARVKTFMSQQQAAQAAK